MKKMHALMGAALATDGANVHWYEKPDAKPGRKMGHLTVTAAHVVEAEAKLDKIVAVAGGDADAVEKKPARVGIIMGSDSDLPTMAAAAETLESFGIAVEVTVISAHRTPERMFEYAKTAQRRGLRCIIAGAGGAAHLPGMVAAMTPLPVIGVPVPLKHLDGVDSVHSILQMPRGVPVATVAIGNSTNAGLLAARVVGAYEPEALALMEKYQVRSAIQTFFTHRSVSTFDRDSFRLTGELFLYGMAIRTTWSRRCSGRRRRWRTRGGRSTSRGCERRGARSDGVAY
jgi:phosphoribosylaminoimidazole carboxylase